ncbi:MAG: putative bifunctional diguanylate cyclase/phosphodiesterase [Dehalococcoidia bacterium]
MTNSSDKRHTAPARGRNGRRPSNGAPGWSASDRMLIVDGDGEITPLSQHASAWKIPQSGRIMPLNQRFSQMREVPQSILARLENENGLRHALKADELVLHYQPQFSVETGRIVGAEALVRWQHPELGLVPPLDFIPLAEETGAIVPLGEWVMHTACAQAKRWQDQGLPPITVAVNVSPRQFWEPSLLPMVKEALAGTGLDPDRLEFEITETTAMQNVASSSSIIRDLANIGSRISIDDFGSGYCSLGYLKKFALHALKIDQSFVRGVASQPNDAAIADAILALAHALDLEVVAEGVETDDQISFFSERECHRIQGFRLGRPITAESFTQILKQPLDSTGPNSTAGDR